MKNPSYSIRYVSQSSTVRAGSLLVACVFAFSAYYSNADMATILLLGGITVALLLYAAYCKYTVIDLRAKRITIQYWLFVQVSEKVYDLNSVTEVVVTDHVKERRWPKYKMYLYGGATWLHLRTFENVGLALECAGDLANKLQVPLEAFDNRLIPVQPNKSLEPTSTPASEAGAPVTVPAEQGPRQE